MFAFELTKSTGEEAMDSSCAELRLNIAMKAELRCCLSSS